MNSVNIMSKPQSREKAEPSYYVPLLLGLALMFGLRFVPPPAGLSSAGMNILGIFAGTIVMWIFVAVDWPSILCLLALSFSGVVTYQRVLAGSMGSWLVMFLISSYMLSYAVSASGFSRRLAIWAITRPIARKNAFGFLAAFLFGPILIGSVISPTTAVLIFLPIASEIFRELGYKKGDAVPQMVVLGLAFSSTIASSMTPIAHAWPVMAISLLKAGTGLEINFLTYIIFGVITGLCVFAAMLLIFKFVYKPDLSRFSQLNLDRFTESLGPMTKREKLTAATFGLVIIMWVTPSLLTYFAPEIGSALNAYGVAVPAMLGVGIMNLVHVDGKPLMNFKECLGKGVSWPGIMLAGTAMVVSEIMTMDEVGLIDYLVGSISPVIGSVPVVIFLLFIIAWCVIQTNFSSDTVAVTVVYSVAVPIALTMGGAVNPLALTACIGACAGFAYATPPAGGPTNVVAASGWIDLKAMAKYGLLLAGATIVIVLLIGYPLANLLMRQ